MRWDQLDGGLETDAPFGVKRRIRRILWSQDPPRKAVDAPFLDDSPRIPEIQRLGCGAEWIRTLGSDSGTARRQPVVMKPSSRVCVRKSRNGTAGSNPLRSGNEAVRNAGLVSLGRVEYTTCICRLEFLLS